MQGFLGDGTRMFNYRPPESAEELEARLGPLAVPTSFDQRVSSVRARAAWGSAAWADASQVPSIERTERVTLWPAGWGLRYEASGTQRDLAPREGEPPLRL